MTGELPELLQSSSPLPPSPSAPGRGPRSRSASPVPAGLRWLAAGRAYDTSASAALTDSQGSLDLPCQQLPSPLSSPPRPGGLTPAAGRVLAANAPTHFSGAGPLTTGARPGWAGAGRLGHSVQAGRDLAQALRAACAPGSARSLAELQADYRAARALVLDRLRAQREETEAARRAIMAQLGHAIGSGKWRS